VNLRLPLRLMLRLPLRLGLRRAGTEAVSTAGANAAQFGAIVSAAGGLAPGREAVDATSAAALLKVMLLLVPKSAPLQDSGW
jgi:hypothetical protein